MKLNEGPIDLCLALEVEMMNRPRPKRDYVGLSAVGRCMRQSYYYYKYEVERDYSTLLIFEQGDEAETVLVKKMKAAGHEVFGNQLELEWPMTGGLLKGHIDGLLRTDQGTVLFECKTAHPFSVSKLLKSPSGVIDTWPQYYMQAQAYMHCLQMNPIEVSTEILPGPVNKAVFVVLDKGNGAPIFQWVDYDPGYIEREVQPRISKLLRAVRDDSLPEREYDIRTAWQCKGNYCPFRSMCREAGE